MKSLALVVLLVLALLLVGAPVGATVVQSTVSFSPNPPLAPGGQQQVDAGYVVIPSGSTTFSSSHNLQMQTDLLNAQWVIQVIVDGHSAARQTASGNAAFLNGVLLSYPTTRDVSFTVTVTGTVPATATQQVMLIQVEEIDNTGNIVPGSVLTVTQPVVGAPAPATPAITQLPLTPPQTTATPRAPLPALAAVLAAACGVAFATLRRDG
jgi:hypothetical protein